MSLPTNLQAVHPQSTTHQAVFQQPGFQQPGFQQPSFQQPGLPQTTFQQTGPLQAAFPQADLPPAVIPQGDIPWPANPPPTNPQAVAPQLTGHQAGFQQPGLPQTTLQQTGPLPAAFPQADLQQEASAEATLQQGIPPQNFFQQPYHPEEALQRPQESSLSFEERLAAFRPVPEPHPEPVARPGPGRKKKLQRFWAPQDASEDLKKRYGRLQTVDQRVTIAERKLAKNKDKPSCVPHLQNILIRNMQEREDLWTQCQRVEHGLVAIELPLPEAEALAARMHKSWKDECGRYDAKVKKLKADNQQAIDDNGALDIRRLGIKDRQGVQTMCNWIENRWSLLCDSFDTLKYACNLGNEPSLEDFKAFLTRIHKLEIYKGWSEYWFRGESQDIIDRRRRLSDPDPATWGLEYEEPINPAQPEMQNHQYGQLEYAQPADDLQFNHDFGTGLDQAASVGGGFVEHASFSQPQQAPNYEPIQQGLQFQQDLNYDWNQQGHSQLQQPLPHDGNHQEVGLQQAPNYDGNRDGLQEITEEDAEAELQAYEQGLLQQEHLQLPPDQIQQTIAEMERQGLVLSNDQIAEIFGTTGPNGEYQPPQGQEPPNNEATGSSSEPGHADAPHEIDPDYREEQQPEQPQGQEQASNDGQIQEQGHGDQDVQMEDDFPYDSYLELGAYDNVEEGSTEWLENALEGEME